MSDFDDVLERVLMDGSFRAALAADPARALAGYRLSAEEVELLRSQVSGDSGGDRTVETRTSKAGLFGLLGGVGGLAPAPSPHPFASGEFGGGSGGFTGAGPDSVVGHTGAPASFGASGGGDIGTAGPGHLMGSTVDSGAFGGGAHAAIGDELGHPGTLPGDHTPVGYHPHIDVNGDGRWDHYTAVQHADGSIDVYADQNHDGRIDFVGHDRNGDGRIDSADYDENFNGTFETHQTDTNGDGWLDTRQVRGS